MSPSFRLATVALRLWVHFAGFKAIVLVARFPVSWSPGGEDSPSVDRPGKAQTNTKILGWQEMESYWSEGQFWDSGHSPRELCQASTEDEPRSPGGHNEAKAIRAKHAAQNPPK